MENIQIEEGSIPPLDQLMALYENAGWIAYTTNPDVLEQTVTYYEKNGLVKTSDYDVIAFMK